MNFELFGYRIYLGFDDHFHNGPVLPTLYRTEGKWHIVVRGDDMHCYFTWKALFYPRIEIDKIDVPYQTMCRALDAIRTIKARPSTPDDLYSKGWNEARQEAIKVLLEQLYKKGD